MSMEQHPGSTLPGWQGPFYPEGVVALTHAFQGRDSRSGAELMYLGKMTAGYIKCERPPRAGDGYGWFWGVEYQIGGARIMIAMPWGGDDRMIGGVSCERSPAVYVKGSYQQRAVDGVLAELTRVASTAPSTLHQPR